MNREGGGKMGDYGCSGDGDLSKNDLMVKNEFINLYNQWQEYIKKPEIMISSRSEDYINCKPYQDIIKLGEAALPYLIEKIRDGKDSSWKEGQFFLWYAVKEVSGVDLTEENKIFSEQEIAEKYLDWWGARKEK